MPKMRRGLCAGSAITRELRKVTAEAMRHKPQRGEGF
jgi:hypothetical protein